MSIRLSRAEAWEVLSTTHTGIFTSLRADGIPIALPVWFVSFDERIYIDAVTRTKKVARIRSDPRVSFLVESGKRWAELRGHYEIEHLTVEIIPDERILSFDNARIKLTRPGSDTTGGA